MSSNLEVQKICEWCGNEFTARTLTTRYCSHKCNSRSYKAKKREEGVKKVKMRTANFVSEKELKTLNGKEIFTITQTALYLGVSRPTVYSYLKNNELKSVRLGGKNFIRKIDIDSLFENADPYKAIPNKERKSKIEYYSLEEVKKKYGIQNTWIYKTVREKQIPKILDRGKVYFSKYHIDKYFGKRKSDENRGITMWYSVEDICKKYNLSRTAIYCFVSEHMIPKRKEGKKVFYSQKHFDAYKNKEKIEPEYYLAEEAMERFNISRDSLYALIRKYNIPKLKDGRYIRILKPELDKLFSN